MDIISTTCLCIAPTRWTRIAYARRTGFALSATGMGSGSKNCVWGYNPQGSIAARVCAGCRPAAGGFVYNTPTGTFAFGRPVRHKPTSALVACDQVRPIPAGPGQGSETKALGRAPVVSRNGRSMSLCRCAWFCVDGFRLCAAPF